MHEVVSDTAYYCHVFEEKLFLIAVGAVCEVEVTFYRAEVEACTECNDIEKAVFLEFKHIYGTYRTEMFIVGTPVEAVIVQTSINDVIVAR